VDGIKNAFKKVELFERDIATFDKNLEIVITQIEIKNFNYEEVKNKLDDKLLIQSEMIVTHCSE
jgi:sigma54-dependent transcription regulator